MYKNSSINFLSENAVLLHKIVKDLTENVFYAVENHIMGIWKHVLYDIKHKSLHILLPESDNPKLEKYKYFEKYISKKYDMYFFDIVESTGINDGMTISNNTLAYMKYLKNGTWKAETVNLNQYNLRQIDVYMVSRRLNTNQALSYEDNLGQGSEYRHNNDATKKGAGFDIAMAGFEYDEDGKQKDNYFVEILMDKYLYTLKENSLRCLYSLWMDEPIQIQHGITPAMLKYIKGIIYHELYHILQFNNYFKHDDSKVDKTLATKKEMKTLEAKFGKELAKYYNQNIEMYAHLMEFYYEVEGVYDFNEIVTEVKTKRFFTRLTEKNKKRVILTLYKLYNEG